MGVMAPAEPSAKQKQRHDQVSKLSGAEFGPQAMSGTLLSRNQEIVARLETAASASAALNRRLRIYPNAEIFPIHDNRGRRA